MTLIDPTSSFTYAKPSIIIIHLLYLIYKIKIFLHPLELVINVLFKYALRYLLL